MNLIKKHKKFVENHPSVWRYVSIAAIIIILFPVIFIGAFTETPGMYVSMSAYLIIGTWGAYEVLSNLSIPKYMAVLFALLVSIVFFFPSYTFMNIGEIAKNSTLNGLVHSSFDWKILIILIFAPIILLIDNKFRSNGTKAIFQVMIASVTILLVSIFAKMVWLINICDYKEVFYFIPIAIIADSFGYFGGKYFRQYFWNGKKLAPKISPKKTWAGFIIGFITSAIFVGVVGWAMDIYKDLNNVNEIVAIILMTFVLPLISPLGDLLFSGIKRFLGIKDFSNLIPGHGGIMDRVDAMSSVMFVVFILFILG